MTTYTQEQVQILEKVKYMYDFIYKNIEKNLVGRNTINNLEDYEWADRRYDHYDECVDLFNSNTYLSFSEFQIVIGKNVFMKEAENFVNKLGPKIHLSMNLANELNVELDIYDEKEFIDDLLKKTATMREKSFYLHHKKSGVLYYSTNIYRVLNNKMKEYYNQDFKYEVLELISMHPSTIKDDLDYCKNYMRDNNIQYPYQLDWTVRKYIKEKVIDAKLDRIEAAEKQAKLKAEQLESDE